MQRRKIQLHFICLTHTLLVCRKRFLLNNLVFHMRSNWFAIQKCSYKRGSTIRPLLCSFYINSIWKQHRFDSAIYIIWYNKLMWYNMYLIEQLKCTMECDKCVDLTFLMSARQLNKCIYSYMLYGVDTVITL